MNKLSLSMVFKAANAGGLLQLLGFADLPTLAALDQTCKMSRLDALGLIILIKNELTLHHPFQDKVPSLVEAKAYYQELTKLKKHYSGYDYHNIASWLYRSEGMKFQGYPLDTSELFVKAASHNLEVMIKKLFRLNPKLKDLVFANTYFGPLKSFQRAITAKNLAVVQTILDILPIEQRLSLIQIGDDSNYTALHAAIASSDLAMLETILNLFPIEQRLQAVQAQTKYQQTALHFAADSDNPAVLERILTIIPEAKRPAALLARSKNDILPLHNLAYSGTYTTMQGALQLLSKEQLMQTMTLKGGPFQESLLHYAAKAGNRATIKAMLELVPQTYQLRMVQAINNQRENSLHKVAGSGKVPAIEFILNLFFEEDRVAALQKKDKEGKTALHHVAESGQADAIITILQLFPEEQRLAVLQEEDRRGKTPFHYAASSKQADAVIAILQRFLEEQQLVLLQLQDKYPKNVLACAIDDYCPAVIAILLKIIPEEQRLPALLAGFFQANYTIADWFSFFRKPANLPVIFDLLPKRQHVFFCQMQDEDGLNLFQQAIRAGGISAVQAILACYTEQEDSSYAKQKILQVLQARDNEANTALHYAMGDRPAMVRAVLEAFPKKERLAAIQAENSKRETPLHHAACHNNPAIIRMVLAVFPPDQKAMAVQLKDKSDQTPLHHAAACNDNPSVIEALLEIIPTEQRLSIICKNVDNAGESPFNKALTRYSGTNIQAFLRMLTLEERFLLIKKLTLTEVADTNYIQPILQEFPQHLRREAASILKIDLSRYPDLLSFVATELPQPTRASYSTLSRRTSVLPNSNNATNNNGQYGTFSCQGREMANTSGTESEAKNEVRDNRIEQYTGNSYSIFSSNRLQQRQRLLNYDDSEEVYSDDSEEIYYNGLEKTESEASSSCCMIL
jgi:ankyrin repeat protein